MILKGTIMFGSSEELLGDIRLSREFLRQLDLLYDVNVDTVYSLKVMD